MQKIKSEIFRFEDFKIHLVEGYIQKTPIIEYIDKILVMDGGCRSDSPAIKTYLNKISGGNKKVKLVIGSHIHPDHAGGAGYLKKFLNVPMAAPENINDWYSSLGGFIQHKIDISLGHYVAVATKLPFRLMYYPRKIDFDYGLENKKNIPFFHDWKVYSAKGHTLHDVVFFNEKEKILYAADVILKVKDRFFLPIPVTFPRLMKKSIEMIYDLKPEHIFLAHGGYMSGDMIEEAYSVLTRQADMITREYMKNNLLYRLTTIGAEMKNFYGEI